MGTNAKLWTEEEEMIVTRSIDDILKHGNGRNIVTDCQPILDLAKKLDRTPSSIQNKVRMIAIKLGKVRTRSKRLAEACGVQALESVVKKDVVNTKEIRDAVQQDFMERLTAPPEVDFFEENDAVLRAIYSVVDYDHFIKICNTLKNK